MCCTAAMMKRCIIIKLRGLSDRPLNPFGHDKEEEAVHNYLGGFPVETNAGRTVACASNSLGHDKKEEIKRNN